MCARKRRRTADEEGRWKRTKGETEEERKEEEEVRSWKEGRWRRRGKGERDEMTAGGVGGGAGGRMGGAGVEGELDGEEVAKE